MWSAAVPSASSHFAKRSASALTVKASKVCSGLQVVGLVAVVLELGTRRADDGPERSAAEAVCTWSVYAEEREWPLPAVQQVRGHIATRARGGS